MDRLSVHSLDNAIGSSKLTSESCNFSCIAYIIYKQEAPQMLQMRTNIYQDGLNVEAHRAYV